jgi:rare lipoprotein A (peptidoglycan hydrolase)
MGALVPEKGGALRKQSTQGRRIAVAAALSGALFGAPFLLLHNGVTSVHGVHTEATQPRVRPLSALGGNELPSHLVAYTPPTTVPLTKDSGPAVEVASQPVSDTITADVRSPQPLIVDNSMVGQATWYPEAPPGKCASHFLPKGTVVTVTNLANNATTTCVVDDYEAAPYPRVLDMSPSGFAQLEVPSRGVVDVRISW